VEVFRTRGTEAQFFFAIEAALSVNGCGRQRTRALLLSDGERSMGVLCDDLPVGPQSR